MYFAEAERLYIIEHISVTEIARRLNLNEKTVRMWRNEGSWQEKRQQHLKSKEQFHEELYQFARKLMQSIKDDIDQGEKIDQGRLYTFTKLISSLDKVKNYEELQTKKDKQEDKKGLTDDIVAIIEQEVLGLNRK